MIFVGQTLLFPLFYTSGSGSTDPNESGYNRKYNISILQSVGVAHAHREAEPEPGEGLQNQVWSGV